MIQPTTAKVRLDSTHPTGAAGWHAPQSAATDWLTCDDAGNCELIASGRTIRQWSDPLAALYWLDAHRCIDPHSRWIGYLAYEFAAFLDGVQPRHTNSIGLPLFVFSRHPLPSSDSASSSALSAPFAVNSNFPLSARHSYESAVRRAIEYIRAGDIFQANIARTLKLPINSMPAEIYRRLIAANGDWYSAFLDYGSFAIASNSPELFLRIDADKRIISRPIKGTRPPGPGMSAALQSSAKDAAELNMIVDVQRNDLGRICTRGSVRVTEPRKVEAHPTVLHGVATIEGRLRPSTGLVEVLAATFPCGSVTGAPKIRAMQIIDELETSRRGVYCGAIGYLDPDGSMQFNVAIRTMTLLGNAAHVPVGAGIVADSDPAAEFDETLVKARSMLAALGIGTHERALAEMTSK